MENGWQMKCGPTLSSSSSVISYSAQTQAQESRNQMNMSMNMNTGHCVLPHDAQESRLTCLQSPPNVSNTLNFGSCKSVHPEIGTSFLSLLSAPPPLLQHDFQQQSNLKFFSSSHYPASSDLCKADTIPNWPLHNSGYSSPRPSVDVHPVDPSGPTMSVNKYSSRGQSENFDSQRVRITPAGPRNCGNNSIQKGEYSAPSSTVKSEFSNGLNSKAMLEASLQTPLPASKKQASVPSGCPRVFCMGACGDLLLSNTGLLGILCSCHGLHMSVSNFCEHSGLSDVNPGYAVRMDSGESIAQWRKLYLQKFGIRAPEDHRGWDWPEGLLTTSGLAKSSMDVTDRHKVFDISSLFTSSAESAKYVQPWNNVIARKPQSIEYANQMPINKQWEYGCAQRTFPMGFASTSKRNSRTMTDDPITSPTPSCIAVSRLGGIGGSKDDHQSRSLHFNILSPSETSFSAAFKSSHSVGSKAHINLKDGNLLHRGAFASGVELKLGQPSQQGCGSGTTAISAMRSGIRDFQTIPFQQQCTQYLENSKVFEHGDQRLHCHSGSVLSRTKEQFLLDFQKNAPSTANDAFCVGHLKDGLSKSSLVSVLSPPNTSAGPVSMHHMESSDMINNHAHYIPWTLPFQPHADKSALVDIPYNRADGSIRPSGINKSASGMNKTSTSNSKCADNCCNIGSESSFRLYVKQMENCGFFIRDGKTFATVPGEKYNSLQMDGMLPEISYASNSVGKVCSLKRDRDPDHSNSCLGFERSPTLHGSSSGCSPLTGVMGSGHDSASLNNYVDDVQPHDFDESLRVVTLRNVEKSFKEKPTDACLRVNERPRSYSEQRQKRENCSISNFNLQGSFLNPGPSTGSDKNPFNAAHSYSPTFMHDTGCKKAGNIRERTNAEGTNNREAFGAFTRGIPFNSEMTEKCNRGACVLQPKEQLSLRVETEFNGCNMLQRCYEESSAYISGRNNSMVQTIHSNRELHCRGENTKSGLKKQVRVGVVEATQLNGSRFVGDSSLTEKTILSECNQKVKKQLHGQLDFWESQWRDVPSKVDPISVLQCPVAPRKFLDKSGGAESHLKELSAKDISTSDQAAILKDRELSNISSGCSAPAITQASITDAGDTGCDNDQIADQGSAIDRSWSSFDPTDSVKSSQQACCGKGRSTEEDSLEVSPNVERQEFIDEFKQQQSKSKKSKKLGDSGANIGKPYNITQKYDDGSIFRKRKSRIKKTPGTSPEVSDVSLLPPESPLRAGNPADCETSTLEDVQELLQFNDDLCNTSNIDSEDRGFKRRRSGLSTVKMCSRKRDLNGIYNVAEGETDNKRPLKSNEDVVANPERVAHKRLKQFKPAESFMKPAKSTEPSKQIWIYDPDSDETSRSSLNCSPKVGLVSDENVLNQKARPIACGKYGIICDQELDLDQLKPPKIVPLSQVLKSSRRLTKFENQNGLPSTRNMVWSSGGCKFVDTSISSCTRQGNQCILGLSCQGGDHGTSSHGAIQMYHKEEETSIIDSSVSGKLGANGSKKKICVSSRCTATQLKPKKSRMCSLYELSMRGNKFISVNFSLSQNVMCAQSTKFEFERKASEDTRKMDAGKCRASARRSLAKPPCDSFISEADALCCVCGIPNRDSTNCLLECCQCLIRIHQACYGVSRLPNGDWYCRPCKTNSKDVACVLCGYGGGAMTRAFGSRNVVKSLLQAWNVSTESHVMGLGSCEALSAKMDCEKLDSLKFHPSSLVKPVVHNSIIGAVDDPAIKQWVHMVCGLWTPGTRCPNVDIMSAFDVSGVSCQKAHMVCSICKRPGGSCIKCHLETCRIHFHPWCAHQKGLLQSEVEGVDSHQVGFYGICLHHTNYQPCGVESDREPDKIDYETEREKEPTCARTQGYKGKKQDGEWDNFYQQSGKNGCLVTQVQLDAWLYINRQKLKMKRLPVPPLSDVDQDYRKEYARYKQAKGWKHLVVYKSGIHGLGLYTSQFFPRGAVVVEYIGEVVGPRVADKRETEYLSGKKLQYKSACYFFRIDKEQIIDATCKGGIARFVNHSCQPNCVAKVITVRSEKKVVFFAQRAIYPGEEITYDYHFNHEDEGKKIPCFCNSKNCRRFLN